MSEIVEDDLSNLVLEATGASSIIATEVVQRLWSGYGNIVRYQLAGGVVPSAILKHVQWPEQRTHPRGWTTEVGHTRKVESYRVETAWYRRYAAACTDGCRVPRCFDDAGGDGEVVLVLEDLDASGLSGRCSRPNDSQIRACIAWLATFHATFLNEQPDDLWPTGTYWHLATRPDEYEALEDGPLKDAAVELDRRLANSPFQTFVHGDAKLANFCFANDSRGVAAVDFQYVGGGCGMKDLAYFVSSCFDDEECEQRAPALLDHYFAVLGNAIRETSKPVDIDALEKDWRGLYPVAWTDFTRFLRGWSPDHWKLHGYSDRLAREVLDAL